VEKGIKLDLSLTQIGQGVVTGGKSDDWAYGGRANITANLDTQKLGLWPGGFMTVEFESNWSDSVNGDTGALMPVNTNQLFPVPIGDNVALPQLSFAQFVSPYAGAIVGKLDTLTGDANEFAHGKGDRQFFNTALSINPVALAVPYSTLGAGLIVLPTKDPAAALVQLSVLQAKGKATRSGFDDISSDNLVFAGEGRVRTDLFGLTGHQLVGGFYSNAEYTSIDQRLGFVVENRELVRKRDTWAVYYNFDQFLHEIDREAGRGFGLFGRFGASEGNPNPVRYFVSIGLGGTGAMRSRPLDRFGVGFYYADINNPTLQTPFFTRSFLGDEWGGELFYNFALTPWMLLTPDLQVVAPSQQARLVNLGQRETVDTAVILGARLQLLF
jgi:porin